MTPKVIAAYYSTLFDPRGTAPVCDGAWVNNLHTAGAVRRGGVRAAMEDGYRVFAGIAPTHAAPESRQRARNLDMAVAALAACGGNASPHGLRGAVNCTARAPRLFGAGIPLGGWWMLRKRIAVIDDDGQEPAGTRCLHHRVHPLRLACAAD